MHKKLLGTCFAFGASLIAGGSAQASDNAAMDADIQRIEHQWAHITYEVKDSDEQLTQIEALSKDAASPQATQHAPNRSSGKGS